jgi:hypothetical protein
MLGKILIGGMLVIALVATGLNVVASICLVRTEQLTRFQKIAQGVVVWLVPIVGALVVLHLLVESDPNMVRHRWIPNDTINAQLLQVLGLEARVIDRVAAQEIENFAVDIFTGHASGSDSGSTPDAGHSSDH